MGFDNSSDYLLDRHVRAGDGDRIALRVRGQSLTYARGDNVTIETTALTVLAMVKSGRFTTQVNKSLTYLVKAKQGNGTWGSTQATILALKALLSGMAGSQVKGTIPFTILVNGAKAAKGEVTEENADVMQAFDLKDFTQTGANRVTTP